MPPRLHGLRYACIRGKRVGDNYEITNILFTNEVTPWTSNDWVRFSLHSDRERHVTGFFHLLTTGKTLDGQALRYGNGLRWSGPGTLTGRVE